MMSDYLTCGQCLREFPLHNINQFIQHKKLDCDDEVDTEIQNAELQCSSCLRGFVSSWALLVHAQLTHNLKIFLQRASQSLLAESSPWKPESKLPTMKQGTRPLQAGNVTVQVHSTVKMDTGTTQGISQSELSLVCNRNSEAVSVQRTHDNQIQGRHLLNQKSDNVLVSVSSFHGTVPSQTGHESKQMFIAPPGHVRSNLHGCNIVIQKDLISNSKVISMNGNDSTIDLLPFSQQNLRNIVSQPVIRPYISKNVSSCEISNDVQPLSNMITHTNATSDSLTYISSVPGLISSISTGQTLLTGEQCRSKETLVPVNGENSQNLVVRHEEYLPPLQSEVPKANKDVDKTAPNIDRQFEILPVTNFNAGADVPSLDQHLIDSRNHLNVNRTDCSPEQSDSVGEQTRSVTGTPHPNLMLNESKKASVGGAACLDGDEVGAASTGDEAGMDAAEVEDCCSNQGCGVTVIPGSHQNLQKCCNAVLPKKRKRHMEMKHMPFSWSSSKYAKRKNYRFSSTGLSKSNLSPYLSTGSSKSTSSSFASKATGGTIVIDVGSDSFQSEDSPMGISQKQTNTPTVTISREYVQSASTNNTNPEFTFTKSTDGGSEGRSRSLILQPGAVFSIPFSYNIPASATIVSAASPSFVAEKLTQAQISLDKKKHCDTNGTNQTDPSTSSTTVSSIVNSSSVFTDNVEQAGLFDEGSSHLLAAGSQLVLDGGEFRRRKYPTSRPFQCDKCPMAFNQRIHLKKHMSKHTGVKPYKCGECDYSTVERSHLKVHIRIHTGEKPFKCTFCEYATAQNSTLKIHLKRHHGGKMFECNNCDKKFTQEQQLKGHEWEHGPLAVISPAKDGTASNSESSAESSHTTVSQEPLPDGSQEPNTALNQEPAPNGTRQPKVAVDQEPAPDGTQQPKAALNLEPVSYGTQPRGTAVDQEPVPDCTRQPNVPVDQVPDSTQGPNVGSNQEQDPVTAAGSKDQVGVIVEHSGDDLVIDEIDSLVADDGGVGVTDSNVE